MFLIKNRKLADAQYLLNFLLEVTVENHITSFWKVTFATYGGVSLELFRTTTFETILQETGTVQFSVFLYKYMSCL